MATIRVSNLGGINLYVNPLSQQDGDLIRAVNVDSYPYGAKSKRPGYATFLGTADGSAVTNLFTWTRNNGTTFFDYRASGSSLYYSLQGTGAWTLAGNGTIGAGARVGAAVLGDTLFICDGVGSTRHTTNGTSFTNTSVAPVAVDVEMYQNRIYLAGTASTLFYSSAGDGTNWNTSGTSDSSSLTIPGPGKLNKIFKANDRLVASKNSGYMFKWDGYSLVDTSTELGPTSPASVAQSEGYYFWLNRLGHYGYGGGKPQVLSNAIERQIYNDANTGIAGGTFNTAPGVVHRYDYLLSVGTVTDDFTNETVSNAVIKYDYQKNEYLNYSFNKAPTAWLSRKDVNGQQQLIFGDANGQCYTYGGTATTDNGATIESVIEFTLHLGVPELKKEFRWFWAFFNPGCQAKVQIALGDTYTKGKKKWKDLGDCTSGICEFRFPPGSSGRILFIKIYEASRDARFNLYGFALDAEPIPQ